MSWARIIDCLWETADVPQGFNKSSDGQSSFTRQRKEMHVKSFERDKASFNQNTILHPWSETHMVSNSVFYVFLSIGHPP